MGGGRGEEEGEGEEKETKVKQRVKREAGGEKRGKGDITIMIQGNKQHFP